MHWNQVQKDMITSEIWKCCLNCNEFDKVFGICKRPKKKPPLLTVVTGCKHWIAELPF